MDVETRNCELHEIANTDGGVGWSWDVLSSFDSCKEYDCTEFWRSVVKKRLSDSLAYLSNLTRP